MYPNQRHTGPPCHGFRPQMGRPPPPRPSFGSCPWQMPQNQPQPPRGFRPHFTNRPPPPRQYCAQRNNNFFGSGNDMFGSGPVNCPKESFPFTSPPPPVQPQPNFQNPPPGQAPPFNQPPRPRLGFQQQQHPQRGGGQFQGRGRGMQNGQGLGGGFRGRGRGQAGNPGQQGGNNNGLKKQKKEKVDKRELPENNVFYCDTCDRGFKTEEKYKEHVDGHQKCSFKDCPFIAAPKLVQIHMNLQHRGGMAKKIYSLQSAEDLAKWKEERKKNFPTSENIEKKKKQHQEKISRGEVIETKDFSKMKGRGRGRGKQNRGRRGKGQGRWKDFNQTEEAEEMDEDDSPTEVKIKRPQPEESIDSSTDRVSCDQSSSTVASVTKATDNSIDGTTTRGPSLSLLSGYGDCSGAESDAEDADGKNTNTSPSNPGSSQQDTSSGLVTSSSQHPNTTSTADSQTSARHSKLLSELQDAMSAAAETATAHAEAIEDEQEPGTNDNASKRKRKGDNKNSKKGKQNGKKAKMQKQPVPQKRKYTLLEKLLAPDIRRERNKILQCVHYIVKHNFFGEKKTDSPFPS